ncbi:hypothetical protein BRC72_12780 [Halobacteriales archaeon QH_7_66_36]|nr:MAG: hypothetical protein BRC72_12780 [Halobacteriales archaeon QH_7_66_36]
MATVDDETILEVLRSNDALRMTTTEVAGQLPVTRGTTRTRLQGLVDEGLLERTTDGNEVVWWLPEREAEPTGETEIAEGEAETTESAESAAETEVEVTATEQSTAEPESGPTAVEVEAVDDDPAVETPDPATETRSGAERDDEVDLPDLSDDEEGLRALALVAVALVAVLLLRKLLGGE